MSVYVTVPKMGQFTDNETAALDENLAALCVEPGRAALRQLMEYAAELVRWSRRVDLTGATTATQLVRGPLFDALTLVPALDQGPTLVDIGSGGGLPGIPAAILKSSLCVTLVEPRSRRAAFLRHVVHVLGLDVEVVQCRAEELRDGQWTGAVVQALWPAATWLQRAPRLVTPGGTIYCLSAKKIGSDDLPPSVFIEYERCFVRPYDKVQRWVTRIRCRDAT